MSARESPRDRFALRRHKEGVAFLVVKFLRVYAEFTGIAADFAVSSAGTGEALGGSGLFERVRVLTVSLAYDLKEIAHSLFRAEAQTGVHPTGRGKRQLLAGRMNSVERLSIDSYVGTGYHLLQILQESLYQLERYMPGLEHEKSEAAHILDLGRAGGAGRGDEEKSEMERLRALEEISATLAVESLDLARQVMKRCETLLSGTALVIRRFLTTARDNEILILNLLQSTDLVESVYGKGSAEEILAELCARTGSAEETGTERALRYVREHCGNISALEAGTTS
jgi:hypothetical protein